MLLLAMSVGPSVCPSSLEITLERGYSISTMPIVFNFGLNIDIEIMNV